LSREYLQSRCSPSDPWNCRISSGSPCITTSIITISVVMVPSKTQTISCASTSVSVFLLFSHHCIVPQTGSLHAAAHCLDILRQQLMCTVDIGVLGQVWWDKEQPKAYPDFNTRHKCRDFEAVRQWAEEHQAPEDVPLDYLRPPLSREVVYTSIP